MSSECCHAGCCNGSIEMVLCDSFDQARLIRQNQIFAANGIGPNGESL